MESMHSQWSVAASRVQEVERALPPGLTTPDGRSCRTGVLCCNFFSFCFSLLSIEVYVVIPLKPCAHV